MNVISPMIELIGPSVGRSTPAGRPTRLEALGHDLARAVDVLAPLELHPDDGDARPRDRADAAHAGRAVQRRLDGERDEQLDLLGRQALAPR